MNNTQRPVEEIADVFMAQYLFSDGRGFGASGKKFVGSAKKQIVNLIISERQESDKLRQENEALKAQVSGLVGALEIIKHAGYPKYPNVATPYELQKIAIEALSTLSSTFLEIQKAKENVIEAAKKSVDWHMRHSQYHVTDSNLQEALRTLQQAQEKK